MQWGGATWSGTAARLLARVASLRLLDDYPARPQQRETWAELCKWGAVAIGVPCLTSAVAVLILALVGYL